MNRIDEAIEQCMEAVERAERNSPAKEFKPLDRVWDALVHWNGYGNRCNRCVCRCRIYSNGQRAVVVLTELKANESTSITNDFERVANQLRSVVIQFIPEANFPGAVIWVEQYEERPHEMNLVMLECTDKVAVLGHAGLATAGGVLHSPRWLRMKDATLRALDIPREEVFHASIA